MSNLKTAIENLYSTFSRYSTAGIHHCDCGCIKEEDVAKLHSKPLSKLEEGDLVSYHGSALYTWGDLQHYKHFLPRVFELYATKESGRPLTDLFDIGRKMEYAEWTTWPEYEVQVVKDFVLATWREFINNRIFEYGDIELEHFSRFIDIEQLLQHWDVIGSEKALNNFVLFFYYNGNQVLDHKFKVNEKNSGTLLRTLINTPGLIQKLQDEFFKQETADKEYAEKISIVLQMIEAQLKVDALKGQAQ